MKHFLAWAAMAVLWIPGAAPAKPAAHAPLSGTWECVAHGYQQHDLKFTLHLKQAPDSRLTGWVRSPLGSAGLTSVDFRNNQLDIHIDTPQGNYRLYARREQNRPRGHLVQRFQPKRRLEGHKTSDNSNPQ